MTSSKMEGPGGSMSQVVGIPNNPYKPITNTRGFAPGFVNYKIGCTRLAATSDKFNQLLAHCRWFSPGTPASSTTNTGRHDIAEIYIAERGVKHQKPTDQPTTSNISITRVQSCEK